MRDGYPEVDETSSITVASHAPLFIIINGGSGQRDPTGTRATIENVLAQGDRPYRIIVVEDAARLGRVASEVVERARAEGGVIVAAGGDGTINAVARAVLGSGCAFGVIPQGTFNYFAREHGIPLDTAEATRALLDARPRPVPVGLINDRAFLVNASLGLYPRLLEEREAYKRHFGRSRLVAFVAGLLTLLRPYRQLRLKVTHGGETRTMRTLTLFVGNNRLQLEQIGIRQPSAVPDERLTAIMVRPVGTLAMLRLLLSGALRQLGEADEITSFDFSEMSVSPARRFAVQRVKVATDGEVVRLTTPLRFRRSPEPLHLLAAAPAPLATSPQPDAPG